VASRRLVSIGVGVLAVGLSWVAAIGSPAVSAIRTSPESRAAYLAHAEIWREPRALSPAELLEGPPETFPFTFDQATREPGIACTYAQPGRELGGHSEKFRCRTADGRDLRLKYWDIESRMGNREAFATVAASRLMWALGFHTLPAESITVVCSGCPENPHEGAGTPRTRRYVAMLEAGWPMPVILSGGNRAQGWSWLELDTAIRSLPQGPERLRQRTHFDALTLLGVLLQHGDRKSEQQALYCGGPVDASAGKVVAGKSAAALPTLVERPGASACPAPGVAIVDIGATFGSAGRTSSETTAKMNLEEWTKKHLFLKNGDGTCRGDLTISLKAGHDGEGNPPISEEGRVFLLEQLHRLTPDHVRALFRAARVDRLQPRDARAAPEGSNAIDAWTAAFEDKVREIEAQRCQGASD
jgi:hypothetical protein